MTPTWLLDDAQHSFVHLLGEGEEGWRRKGGGRGGGGRGGRGGGGGGETSYPSSGTQTHRAQYLSSLWQPGRS